MNMPTESLGDFGTLFFSALAVWICFMIGVFVFSQKPHEQSNREFFWFITWACAWGFAMLLLRSGVSISYYSNVSISKFLFCSAAIAPLFLYRYLTTYTDALYKSTFVSRVLHFSTLFQILVIVSPFFILDVAFLSDGSPKITTNKIFHILFGLHILLIFAAFFKTLFSARKTLSGTNNPLIPHLQIMFYATSITFILAFIFNLVLPLFQIATFNWFGPFALLFLSSIYAYGMYEHRLFDTKLVVAQIIAGLMTVLSLVQMLQSKTSLENIAGFVLFLFTIFFGAFLVQSISREVRTREYAENLALKLEENNVELARLNAQKSEFLSIATHQLRTPLGAMNGYTSLVLGGSFGEISDKVKEVLSKVLQSGMLMNGTIEDFLSVSRIDQGRMVYDMTDFPIQKLTREVFDELKAGAERKGLALRYEVPEIEFIVHADYGKLKHVISNLVDNSIKYTREGWVRISAETVGGYVRVSVSDSGVGIPSDELPKLFDKFVRARGASGVNVSGTGLGLYVAKQMIEAHSGHVWAESEGEGKGATFIAELPLAPKV